MIGEQNLCKTMKRGDKDMCTAATYTTKDFYFGRTLDYEFSYGENIVITPRNFCFQFSRTVKAPLCHDRHGPRSL